MLFEVTEQEANIIMTGLAELPLKVSLELVQKLQKQGQEQLSSESL